MTENDWFFELWTALTGHVREEDDAEDSQSEVD